MSLGQRPFPLQSLARSLDFRLQDLHMDAAGFNVSKVQLIIAWLRLIRLTVLLLISWCSQPRAILIARNRVRSHRGAIECGSKGPSCHHVCYICLSLKTLYIESVTSSNLQVLPSWMAQTLAWSGTAYVPCVCPAT